MKESATPSVTATRTPFSGTGPNATGLARPVPIRGFRIWCVVISWGSSPSETTHAAQSPTEAPTSASPSITDEQPRALPALMARRHGLVGSCQCVCACVRRGINRVAHEGVHKRADHSFCGFRGTAHPACAVRQGDDRPVTLLNHLHPVVALFGRRLL